MQRNRNTEYTVDYGEEIPTLRPLSQKTKLLIVILIMGIAISLNLLTLLQALPETQKIDPGCCASGNTTLAKDFSAFYFGAWNLIHSPSVIYSIGSTQNASFLGISPHPETFKYFPSFLILIVPFLILNYAQALYVFDLIQFAMLILIAFLLYKIVEKENVAIIGTVSVIALLLPFSMVPSWGVSEAYFWQWAEGQSKVLELALILLSFYFGLKKKPILSGIFYGLSFFDPRFSLVALPLFVTLNRGTISKAGAITIFTLLVTNLPIMALPDVAAGFFHMLDIGGASTPFYPYSYIPLLAVVALSLVKWRDVSMTFGSMLQKRPQTPKVDDLTNNDNQNDSRDCGRISVGKRSSLATSV
jgi:hypothetical protein